MRSKYVLFITLVLSAFLTTSMFSGIAINLTNYAPESLEVVKEVFDGAKWNESIDAAQGDEVQFRITFTYYNVTDPEGQHWAKNIIVNDTLPECMEYVPGSGDPDEPTIDGQLLMWDLGSVTINHEESYVIKFNATISEDEQCCCIGELVNKVNVTAWEHCTNQYIYGEDIATVYIDPSGGNADIDIEKKVWDNVCNWAEEIWEYPGNIVRFNITITNTGDVNLNSLVINDTLSESLEYANYATVNGTPKEPDNIVGNLLQWFWNDLAVGESLFIEFNATVVGLPCSEDINEVTVEAEGACGQKVSDTDTASVFISGMCMEKEVWDDNIGAWKEETDSYLGDTVRFRITIYYYGEYKLYNISVRDVLPECFEYANNAIPEEPTGQDGNIIWWNFSEYVNYLDYELLNGESLIIEFDAYIAGGICEECINWAYVVAEESSGIVVQWEDPATVLVDCEFVADAHGPYSGGIDQAISITGSATSGTLPYKSFEWELDGDGLYDDATGESTSWSWSEAGSYTIWLKVTDDDDKTAIDYASVTIEEGQNSAPNKPNKPSGPTQGTAGTTYTYTASTTDPDGDQLEYFFDWGDETNSGWQGPYNSGEICSVTHIFTQGTFEIKVKARDTKHAESAWSDPLSVTMPRNLFGFDNPVLQRLIFRLLEKFPILARILGI